MSLTIKALLTIAILWAIVVVTIWAAGSAKVTPEKIAAYVAEHPLEETADGEREALIREIADQVNRLNFEQRQEARKQGDSSFRTFYEGLRPGERALFTELTIGPTFDHMMRAFNAMEPEERRKIAERTIARLKESGQLAGPEANRLEARGVEMFERVTREGLRAFYEEANADTKIDFAPVLEEMQRVLQNPRGGGWKPRPPKS